jgi:phosphoribosyl 1,2-cyclic phosphodiesterase
MRRHGVPLWTGAGTWHAMQRETPPPPGWHCARDGEAIRIGDLELRPFAVPHDAAEPLQLVCSDGRVRLGILTDVGEINASVIAALQGCAALLLECNHDAEMLARGPYPAFLKQRIGGPRGHLANSQSAQLLAACHHGGLRHVVAAHLSVQNNRPALAAGTLAQVLGCRADEVVVADALAGSPWLDVG